MKLTVASTSNQRQKTDAEHADYIFSTYDIFQQRQHHLHRHGFRHYRRRNSSVDIISLLVGPC